ncbi:MAG: radical SAM protein [Chloroflexota bacterium]|nr:radical SAM protein [Chloroflexota bacterium]
MSFEVLLINPNQMKPAVAPIGLDYLAASLQAEGFGVKVLDLCFADDVHTALDAYFHDHNVDAVGLFIRNTDDCYYTGQDFFLPRYREWTSGPVILGGVGFSIMPQAVLRYCGADLGIVGDGEWALPALLSRLARGEGYDDVPGLAYRTDQGIVVNPPAFRDLDELPFPRRGAIDNGRYLREGGMGGIETKRGCPRHCIYCADPVAKGRVSRARSPDNVADEIEQLLELGVDWLHTCDSEFNIPAHHAQAVCEEMIRRGLGDRVHWHAYCAPRPFSRQLARLMRRAGCVGIDFGVDSGDDGMLHRLGRYHTAEDLREVARICRGEGITFMYDLLLGGPGETRDTVRRTIELMREVNPSRVGVAVGVRIYPGTPLARMVRRQGVDPSNPHLHGRVLGNDDLLEPIFYLSADMGPDPLSFIGDLVGDDERFFFGGAEEEGADYDYNENELLVEAIQQGYRGAFWDILRRLREEGW